jgi:hypothetical protein
MTPELSLEQLCATLAEEFLSGPWTEEELTARGRALFPRGRWRLVDLFVAAAWATYRRPPRDRPGELTATMLAALLPDPARGHSLRARFPWGAGGRCSSCRILPRWRTLPSSYRLSCSGTSTCVGCSGVLGMSGCGTTATRGGPQRVGLLG